MISLSTASYNKLLIKVLQFKAVNRIKFFPFVKMKHYSLMFCALVINLMTSCNFDKPKTASNSKVIERTVPQGRPDTAIKFLAGPTFPRTARAACCKGIPSRAKATTAKK